MSWETQLDNRYQRPSYLGNNFDPVNESIQNKWQNIIIKIMLHGSNWFIVVKETDRPTDKHKYHKSYRRYATKNRQILKTLLVYNNVLLIKVFKYIGMKYSYG